MCGCVAGKFGMQYATSICW